MGDDYLSTDSDATSPRSRSVDVSVQSLPTTMVSKQLPPCQIYSCNRQEVESALLHGAGQLGFPRVRCEQKRATILAALKLVCDEARGGTLICISSRRAFGKVFGIEQIGGDSARRGASLISSDSGYMTERLRGVHVEDERFAAAFRDFTERCESDRWPEDHPDRDARGRPKDGAFLLSNEGFRLKCAVKILGLVPPASWPNVGTKHEAALACAGAVRGACAIVRSESGAVHFILRHKQNICNYDLGIFAKPCKAQ